ncbi:esterase-like activity of phytase family protein [Pseudoduganella eburnea]|uniref:Esterase-like activity of phytase family protein n=1 Tax=Massilia eburnea TaxID=1776165 RepID=A0A6L6QIQ0_9BURK|nr:esterase-like activity of phytase family protein [Massilia eburnea]MTW12129.1 esterase-like activity of phytase family protein [Massilia eburnea]
MMQTVRHLAAVARAATLAAALAACASAPQPAPVVNASPVSALRLIGEQRVPHRALFEGTMLGGFSGLDYDAAHGRWLVESDDRCTHNPARFYEAELDFDATAFRAVRFVGVHYFMNSDGKDYVASPAGCAQADVESIRLDPLDGSMWYASEGDRRAGLDPFIRHATRAGGYLADLPLPDNFKVHKDEERGSRYNAVFEGLAFAPDGRSLWASLEWPLYEDGPIPTPQAGGMVRMTQFQRDGKVLRQFAYPLDAIPAQPGPGKEAENGVSEILVLPDGELLVLERATVQDAADVHHNYVRIYATDARGASDVKSLPALTGANFTPARKRLVLDSRTLGLPRVDNLEAMAFGPRLPNGHATLVMASDDNFRQTQVSQFLLFEVLP